jgi:hypothetical protein
MAPVAIFVHLASERSQETGTLSLFRNVDSHFLGPGEESQRAKVLVIEDCAPMSESRSSQVPVVSQRFVQSCKLVARLH